MPSRRSDPRSAERGGVRQIFSDFGRTNLCLPLNLPLDCRRPESQCGELMRRLITKSGSLLSVALASTLCSTAWANDPTCCCTAHVTPSCSDAACSAKVCAIDPYCCNTRWDAICATKAAQLCGAAAPYCIDSNQDNTPDICAAGGGGGGTGGADCDNDGQPDTLRNGPAGKSSWSGPTNGFHFFEPEQNWTLGRPGALTFAEVAVPYTQYYNALQIKTDCDNAVRSLEVTDGGTSNLHDLTFDLNMRTLRFAGPAAHSVLVTPNSFDTLRLEFRNGSIDGTSNPFSITSTGALQLTFGNIDLQSDSFSWKTTSSWTADPILLVDSDFKIRSWDWPKNAAGDDLFAYLRLSKSRLLFQGQSPTFTVPDQAWISVYSNTTYDYSEITGTGGVKMITEPGSLITLDGTLTVDSLAIDGALQIRPHCLTLAEGCRPSRLGAQEFSCGVNSKASITCSVDLSGNSGTTPFGSAVISASVEADVGGILNINDMSNGEPVLEGYAVPLIWAANFLPGGSNFDVVRMLGAGLSGGLYVTTTESAGTISLEVRRGLQVAAAPVANASIPQAPVKSVMLDDGLISGIQRIASVTNGGQNFSLIRVDKLDPQFGFLQEWVTYGPADPTDLDVGDIDGDSKVDIVVSFGSPGKVIAYKQVANNGVPSFVTLWQNQLEAGRRAECVAILPPDGPRASLLPTGATTATGTSKNGSGSITTVSSTGTTTGTAETAAVPRTVRGTDIDNDEDTDVVAGGGSDAAELLPSGPAGFIQVIQRDVTGGFSSRPAIPTAGVPNSIAIGDLDGDGYPDVAASCDGISGSFPNGARPTGIVLRGAPVTGPGSRPSLLRNPCPVDVGGLSAQGKGVSILDGDGDGNPDLALAWESNDFQTPSGGAAIFPIRDPRPTGGLSIATPAQFVTGPVLQMIPAGRAGLITFTQSTQNLTGGVDVDQTEFGAAAIAGDLDGDGLVGPSDISILLLEFGACTSSNCPADLDGTGFVDNADISLLLLLFD